MSIKNVVIAGATGSIGRPIVQALLDSKQFNITILSRSSNKDASTGFPDVCTTYVDYDDVTSLTAALQGADAVISALSSNSPQPQLNLLEAAVQAKVARFLPSEFGSDTSNPNSSKLPFFAGKKLVESRIEALAAENKISYTYIFTGPFLDLGLQMSFLGIDLKKRQVSYLDGGNATFSTTTRKTVGKAVASALIHADETKNRAVRVQEASLSVRDLFRYSKRALGEEGWTEVDGGSTADLEKASLEKWSQGQKDFGVILGFLLCAFLKEGYGGQFKELDNELLGIEQIGGKDIVEIIKGL